MRRYDRRLASRRIPPVPTTPASLDEAPGPLFRHDNIDLNKRVFRLLRILPILERVLTLKSVSPLEAIPSWDLKCTWEAGTTWADMPSSEVYIMQFDLVTLPFDGKIAGAYNAVSYEWGPDEPPFHWIRVNDGYLRIRQNLYSFLRAAHISHLSRREFIWIDAICIDQGNISERGHQVKQMADIYSCANSVLAWLGPDVSDTIEAASGTLLQMGEEVEELLRSKKQNLDWSPVMYKARQIFCPPNKPFLALFELCAKSYWTRMWIFQEVFSAREAWLVLGELRFSWQLIRRMFHPLMLFDEESLINPALRTVDELSRTLYQNYRHRPICDTVNAFCQGICSDSRDRVYAMLGLVQGRK
jgi:hypothetical protein